MRVGRLSCLVSLLLCGACADGVTEAPGVTLRVATDSAVYSRTESGEAFAHLTLEHQGGRAVALTGCPQPPALYVERATVAGWEEQYSSGIICQAIYSPSTIALTANASLAFSVSASQPGRYRVRVLIGPDAAAPEHAIVSNEFVVR